MSHRNGTRDLPNGLENSLLAAKSGEPSEVGKVLDHYRNYLWTIASEKLSQAVESKISPSDLVQESLLKAYQTFSQFQGTTDAELQLWLRRILSGTMVDAYRRYTDQKRNVDLEIPLAGDCDTLTLALCATDPSPSSKYRHTENAQLVQAALQQLAPQQRQLVVWRNLEQLPFHAIAERMSCSTSEARRRWAAAIEALAILLQRYEHDVT